MDDRRLTIPGRYDRIKEVGEFVQETARLAGLDEKAQHHCQVAVDEACSNIIEHGYQGEDRGPIEILCSSPQVGTLIVELRDQAGPFDPASIPHPDPSQSLEERRAGGWGMHLMAQLMDGVQYERVDGVNILRMAKHRSKPQFRSTRRQH